jgi:hypothetical protein
MGGWLKHREDTSKAGGTQIFRADVSTEMVTGVILPSMLALLNFHV